MKLRLAPPPSPDAYQAALAEAQGMETSSVLEPRTIMRAVAEGSCDELRHEVCVNYRHVIHTDEPRSIGGTDTAPAPHELLPAALASCISTMVALYAKRKGWEIGDEIRVEVEYDYKAEPREF